MYSVFIPKLFPNTTVDNIKSGMDMHSDIVDTGIPMIVEQTKDNPVIPPGANPVSTKKKFTATAVIKAAKVIHP